MALSDCLLDAVTFDASVTSFIPSRKLPDVGETFISLHQGYIVGNVPDGSAAGPVTFRQNAFGDVALHIDTAKLYKLTLIYMH
jgi:hypothetical protein